MKFRQVFRSGTNFDDFRVSRSPFHRNAERGRGGGNTLRLSIFIFRKYTTEVYVVNVHRKPLTVFIAEIDTKSKTTTTTVRIILSYRFLANVNVFKRISETVADDFTLARARTRGGFF